MYVIVTLAKDGRRLQIDAVDVVVCEGGGTPVALAHAIPGGIIRVGHCNDTDWDQLCAEAGVDNSRRLPGIG